jgi:hypothetical protein
MIKKTIIGLAAATVLIAGCVIAGCDIENITESRVNADEKAGFTYTAYSGRVTVTGYTGNAKDVTVPSRINNKPVTAIGDRAFEDKELTSVAIPGSVTVIGDYAFSGNPLASVIIGAKVNLAGDSFPGDLADVYTGTSKQAGTYLREGSDGWKWQVPKYGDFEYSVPDGKLIITGYAGNAPDVAIPDLIDGQPVTAIGDKAFEDKELTSVAIPGSVTVIGDYAFASNQLTGVTIPDGVTTIGTYAFSENPLTSVAIGTDVDVAENAFPGDLNDVYEQEPSQAGAYLSGNGGVTWTKTKFTYDTSNGIVTVTGYMGSEKNVTIPDRIGNQPVTAIGDSAFYNYQFTGVTIPDSVTVIGDSAFYNNSLTSVTIPHSVTVIGDSAFYSNSLTQLSLGNGVTAIGDSAFYNNSLTQLTIPHSVTAIGGYAFYRNSLASITLGNGVTIIGEYAFYGNSLTSITIPNSVTTIGYAAFDSNQLTSAAIGNSVIIIGTYAFWDNPLTSVAIGAGVNLMEKSFPESLVARYLGLGRQAGIYTRPNSNTTIWTKQ